MNRDPKPQSNPSQIPTTQFQFPEKEKATAHLFIGLLLFDFASLLQRFFHHRVQHEPAARPGTVKI
jgi:hypothetical protein